MKYKLSDICDVKVGFPFKSELFNENGDGIRLVRGMNVSCAGFRWGNQTRWWNYYTKDLEKYLLKEEDVLIAMDGNVSTNFVQVTKDDLPLLLVQRVARLRAKNVPQKIVWYIVKSHEFGAYLDSVKTGTTISHISAKQIGDYEIDLPDYLTQEKISSILSILDDKIRLNNKINNNLEQQAQAIFKEWFIDNPENENWSNGTFSELIQSTLSGDWGKEAPTGNNTEKVYCVRGADIPEVRAGNKGKMPTRYILPKNYASKKLTAGDIVVEISGGSPTQSTGRCTAISESLLNRYDSGMVCTNFCRAIKPLSGYSMFIYYYWQYLYDKGVFFSYENGTTGIKNLDISGFLGTEPIIIPPKEKVLAFDDYCQTVFDRIFANGKESEQLSQLRDILLSKLMSGELDVSDIEI